MRKLILSVLAAVLCLSVIPAHADGILYLKSKKNRAASRTGTLDSTSFTLAAGAAGAASAETLQTVSTSTWAWDRHHTTATAAGIAKLLIATQTAAGFTGDSLYYSIQVSPDGTTWATATAFTGLAAATAGDQVIALPITADSDQAGLNLFRVPNFRILLRGDSGTAASSAATTATLMYPLINEGDAQ